MDENINAKDDSSGNIGRNSGLAELIKFKGRYSIECFGSDGKLKWSDTIDNLITTVGCNHMLDNELSGSAYTAAWYIGLISSTSYTTGPAAGDTSASHGGWAEDQNYSQGARPTTAWSAASAKSKSLSSALAFSINATTTIKGCFMISNSTKGGSTGTLFSAGLFSGGDKAVGNGDTLNVSYTGTMT